MVTPIPEDYPSNVIPYLVVDGAGAAIDWYAKVFDATDRGRMTAPDGTIAHAEIAIGKGVVMLADPSPGQGYLGPKAIGGTPVTLMVYVEDVDAVFDRAVAAGAEVLQPMKDEFYGDRTGSVVDPFGHRWVISTHVEDVPPEEMERRAAQVFGG